VISKRRNGGVPKRHTPNRKERKERKKPNTKKKHANVQTKVSVKKTAEGAEERYESLVSVT